MPRPKKNTWKGYHPDEQDALTKRIDECNKVLEHISSCPAWEVIVRDLTEQRRVIDDNWQDITDTQKLDKARHLKYAYMHLINIHEKYKQDLEASSKQLEILRNPQENIIRDYDGQ